MKQYVMLGVGYVAPKHMKAIKETGGKLIAVLDPHDSVGILDSYFPDCKYFSEFERFDRYCDSQEIDYVVVCSPNYLHDAHCRFGLRIGADVICEKPLVLNERNLIGLQYMEDNTEHRIWNILQLRLGDSIQSMRESIDSSLYIRAFMWYVAPRGNWYDYSWKANIEKSGGLVTNIGIHLFDLLILVFGSDCNVLRWKNDYRVSRGVIQFGEFAVGIDLSIHRIDKPVRRLSIGTVDFDLSKGFTDLHTKSYEKILKGEGFGIEDVRPAIKLCEQLRGW